MEKKMILIQMMIVAILLAYPFYDSISNNARSMGDLSRLSQSLVWIGVGVFIYLMVPMFISMWYWLKKWINGQ